MKISSYLLIFSLCFGLWALLVFPAEVFPQTKDFSEELSEHFIIKYQQGVDKSDVGRIKNLAEKYYRTITQEFHLIRDELWVWDNRARIFIAKDKKNYLDNFNCFAWSDACVDYMNKVIYTFPNQDHFSSILVHELTHIIFREYVGRNILPLWLDEGMETYIEDKYGGGHYSKRIRSFEDTLKNNQHIQFSRLLSLKVQELDNESKDTVNLYYLEVFSVVNFLITKYGRHNFSRFLSYLQKGYDFKEAMGRVYLDFRDFENFELKWKNYYLN
ncbi:MAG: hypothetical protein JW867_05765 [Candidatus Omnitrophica bacterium]|nr:hypothetical protein [Candidatus Omnitrophota bacterium]